MSYKKVLFVFCLIMCILFSISNIAASDVNNMTMSSEDTIENNELSLPIEDLSEETLDTENGLSDDAPIKDNGDNTLSCANITDDKPILAVQNSDNDVLSSSNAKKYKVTYYKQTGKYSTDKKVYYKVTNLKTGKPVKTSKLLVEIYKNGKYWGEVEVKTNSKGIGALNCKNLLLNEGKYKFKAGITTFDLSKWYLLSNVVQKKITLAKNNAKITAKELVAPKGSNKNFKITIKGQNNKALDEMVLKVQIYTGSKYVTKYLVSNSKGIVNYKVSKLSEGTHKVIISLDHEKYINNNGVYGKTVTSYIIIGNVAEPKNATIEADSSNFYYQSDKNFQIKVIDDETKQPIGDVSLKITIGKGSNSKNVTVKTNSNGIAEYPVFDLNLGSNSITITPIDSKITANSKTCAINILKASLTISAPEVTGTYGKTTKFTATVKNIRTGAPASGVDVTLEIYTGNDVQKVTRKTDSNGQITYSTSTLSADTHKVMITAKGDNYHEKTAESSITISKLSYTITAPKVTGTYGKTTKFTATVKDSSTGKAVSGAEVTLEIYTGNDVQKVTRKTDSSGQVTYSSSSLSAATHKVIVTAKGNDKYKEKTAESSITIKESNNNGNGKIATKITITDKIWIHTVRTPITQFNYRDTNYLMLDITPVLEGADGKIIDGKYKAIITYHNGMNQYAGDSIQGTYGNLGHLAGQALRTGKNSIVLTIEYEGNSKYAGTTFTKTYELRAY